MNRPYIICHMVTSIDGKVTGKFLTSDGGYEAAEYYYEVNRKLKGEAFACGRITMEGSFTDNVKVDCSKWKDVEVPNGDYIAMNHSYYAVSFDRHGNVGWRESMIHDDEGYDNCHIIEVLSKDTPKEYLAYLRDIEVSYIFAGDTDISILVALDKLYHLFGIRKLLLEGGSKINEAFMKSGLVDEISVVVAPVTAGDNAKSLFGEAGSVTDYALAESKIFENSSIVWLRYKRKLL